MKRILIFSLAYYPNHVSGAEVAIREITDRVKPEDIHFYMVTHRFTKDAPSEEQIGNVKVHRVGFGPSYLSKMLFVPLAALKAVSLQRKQKFDGFWVMMTYMLFPLVLAKALGLRGPYVLTLQDGDPYEKVFSRWFIKPVAPILNWGFAHASMVQTISNYLATWPKKRGYKYDDVVIVPNGASVESLKEFSTEELTLLKEKLHKNKGDVLLLAIGRLVNQKATDVIIRALVKLPEHIKLVVVGDGPNRDTLMKLAETLGVRARITFAGQVDRDMTAKFRNVCDIFVFPSRSEGQGISIVSAMLSGIPIIATQVGGIADFLFDAKRNPDKKPTGFAVDVDSPTQIADRVNYILQNPAEVKAVVANAKKLAERDYNWDSIAQTMREKVFGKILAK